MLAGQLPRAGDSKFGEPDDCREDGVTGETAKELLVVLLKAVGLAMMSCQGRAAWLDTGGSAL